MTVKTLIDEKKIATTIEKMAKDIAAQVDGKPLLIVALMRGSFIFAADLARALSTYKLELEFDFLGLSSYKEGTETSGDVIVTADITAKVEGRHVLVIDDILESGLSLTCAKGIMFERKAKKVSTAVLLEKPGKRTVQIDADFVGFEIEDKFVIGYGLDYAGKYRELPFVGYIEK